MSGEIQLDKLLRAIKPKHNIGDYVFCITDDLTIINSGDAVFIFKEPEGNTVVMKKELADRLQLAYSFVASWITLAAHSSLEAIGLTAAFSKALSDEGISCNVVAAFYHDHIFVDKKDTENAMQILSKLAETQAES